MSGGKFLRKLGVEEHSDGKAFKEPELVFYCCINDFTVLEEAKATMESHEQWELKVHPSEKRFAEGRIRIRKTTKDEQVDFVQTTKTKLQGIDISVPIPISEDGFRQFQYICESGMIKDRYVFPIASTGLNWEVDMYPIRNSKGKTKYNEWCRIELENYKPGSPIPPLPFSVIKVIPGTTTNTDEQAFIRDLFDKVFLVPNPYMNRVVE